MGERKLSDDQLSRDYGLRKPGKDMIERDALSKRFVTENITFLIKTEACI